MTLGLISVHSEPFYRYLARFRYTFIRGWKRPNFDGGIMFQDERRSDSFRSRSDEARDYNHPNPAQATWGEVNVLSLASMRAGRTPSPEEAQAILDAAERESDFNDLFRNG